MHCVYFIMIFLAHVWISENLRKNCEGKKIKREIEGDKVGK